MKKYNAVAYGVSMVPKSTLRETDWIQAAFKALSQGGSQAIKVEPIARDLNVSKGSFYWHFKDVAALKDAMLEHWLSAAGDSLFALQQDYELSPTNQARLLVERGFSSPEEPSSHTWIEIAIRDWARYDADASVAIRVMDKKRLTTLADLLRAHGESRSQATTSANTLYASWVGLEQISQRTMIDKKRSVSQLIKLLFLVRDGPL